MKVSRSLRKLGKLGNQIGDQIGNQLDDLASDLTSRRESHFLRTLGWVSAGATALALGLIVGREIRQRYKFNRRTPYDFYAHSGDQVQDVDFGVGI